jgi:hypothetical protein
MDLSIKRPLTGQRVCREENEGEILEKEQRKVVTRYRRRRGNYMRI